MRHSYMITARYQTPVIKKDQPDDSYKTLPLPQPTGSYPYHLSLSAICPGIDETRMVWHMLGDSGGVRNPDFQLRVTEAMADQYTTLPGSEAPRFIYHLGDVVYHFGEAEKYPAQFFKPYAQYPGPIVAIAGNHDSDVNPANPVPYKSLAPFMAVFCDTVSRPVAFSGGAERKSMTQPNVYWTLDTPLATFIGLHSNIPKFGFIGEEQRSWFLQELRKAPRDKWLFVCLHHAPYTADTNHGSSLAMIEFLESAFGESGVRPDAVFSGHVHNYQRFVKTYADGLTLPFIVAGAGGFDDLHSIATLDDARFTGESPLFKGIHLEAFCEDRYGFLKLAIDGSTLTGEYYSLSHEAGDRDVLLTDKFTLNRREK